MTREQIVRAGQEGPALDYVPLGLAALRVMPSDAEVRFLLARAYGGLGLRTAALEQVELLPEAVRGHPSVSQLRAMVEGLPDDRVRMDELIANVEAGIGALRQRRSGAADLRTAVKGWRERASTREHFRTRSGDLAWREPGSVGGWVRLDGQRASAAELRLEHEAGGRAHPPPYFVEGLDGPWVFVRLYDATGRMSDGHSSMIVLAQADVAQFLDGLSQVDLGARLADDRLRVLVGEDAGARAAAMLHERAAMGVRAAGPAITVPTTERRIEPMPAEIVARTIESARRLNGELSERVAEMYRGKDRAYWARRHAEALAGGPRLRVLVVTSRYSTFLRHSAADLRDALAAAGCEATVAMEPDDSALNDATGELLAIAGAAPDLVIVPNYLRANLGGAYRVHVPFLTWVQDSMAHLLSLEAGRSITGLDFVAGNLGEEMFQRFGYPRARALHAPMAASARKFHDGPVTSEQRERHECEVAYVSHHSETVEALHARRRREAGPGAGAALDELLARILALTEEPVAHGLLHPRLRTETEQVLGRHGLPRDGVNVAGAMSTYTLPIADRALRHRTLEWAAEIAERRGWRMHIYGRGWREHPTLGRFDRGELDHGDDLRACYQVARVHLHASMHTAIHQRVFECALSGGLPVCRLQADDLSHLEYLAGAHACRVGPAAVSDPWRRERFGRRVEGYRIDSCDEARKYAKFVCDLGLAAPEFVWLTSVHAERLRSSALEEIDGEGRALWDLWPDPAALMFHDKESLERVLERAMEDGTWRRAQSEALRVRSLERVTYDALAREMLRFVASGLAAPEGQDGRRWYDGAADPAGGAEA